MIKSKLPCLGLLLAVLAQTLVGGVARAEADALERPALMRQRVGAAVMLTVTRADGRLVAAGERGIVQYSDDNGKSWTQAQVPVSVSLTKLYFPSPRLGWAVGHSGVVLHSSDAGATWSKQLDGRLAAAAQLAAARQAASAGTEEGRRRIKTAERLVADGPDKPFFDVYFFDDNRGLIVGAYGLIFATEDGGKSWTPQQHRIDNPKEKHLYGIAIAGKDVYIAGEQGALFRAKDGSGPFEEEKTPYAGTFFGIQSDGKLRLNLFGLRGNAYWSDEGRTWHKSETGAPISLTAGTRLRDGSLVLVDESGRLLHSSDGGASFRAVPMARPAPLTGIVQAADGALVVAGLRGLSRIDAAAAGGAK